MYCLGYPEGCGRYPCLLLLDGAGCPLGAPATRKRVLAKLTIRKIDATRPNPNREIRLLDNDPRGFGIRIKPSGVKTFFVQFRSPVDFVKRRLTLGQYGGIHQIAQAVPLWLFADIQRGSTERPLMTQPGHS